MLKLAILGASGVARQIAWCAQRSGAYQVVGMVDELVSTATEVDGIVIRSQVKDIAAQHAPELNDPAVQMTQEETELFWRERVRLMNSLVQLRYAQAQRTSRHFAPEGYHRTRAHALNTVSA